MRKYVLYCLFTLLALTEVRSQALTDLPTTGYNIINLLDTTFIIRGNAVRQGRFCYLITRDSHYQSGQIWWPEMLDLTQSFRMDFVVSAGTRDSGADGFAFIMQRDPDDTQAAGVAGAGLGIGGSSSQRIQPSLAVEIDTYRNAHNNSCGSDVPVATTGVVDPVDDHFSLIPHGATGCPYPIRTSNANNVLLSYEVYFVLVRPNLRNIEDASVCIRMSIVWDYLAANLQRIRLFTSDIDGSNVNMRLMREDNFINDIFSGETEVRWGYTGATGGSRNQQTICLPTGFGNIDPVDDNAEVGSAQSRLINVSSNDILNSDHPELWVTRIVSPPSNGAASVSSDQKLISYRSNVGFVGTDRLTYEICDVEDGTRCYARCERAVLNLTVNCPGGRNVLIAKNSDNSGCDLNLNTGAGIAKVLETEASGSTTYTEGFRNSAVGSTSGTSTQSDDQETSWSLTEIMVPSGGEVAQVERIGGNSILAIPPGGEYDVDFSIFLAQDVSEAGISVNVATIGTGSFSASMRIGRVDATGSFQALNGAGEALSGSGVARDIEVALPDVDDIGSTSGNYTVRIRVQNDASSSRSLVINNIRLTVRPHSVSNVSNEYTFRWYRGSSVASGTPITAVTTRTINNLVSGEYTVEALRTPDNDCSIESSNTLVVTQLRSEENIRVREESSVTNCESPNGSLSAGVSISGTVVTTGFTFSWFETSDLGSPIATGSQAMGLGALSYTVRVKNNATGCTTSDAKTVSSSLTSPTITLGSKVDAVSCGVGSGSGSARVNSGGGVNGFTFEWFNGRVPPPPAELPATPDFTGSLAENLSAGYYSVRAVEDGNDCKSPALEVEIAGVANEIEILPTLEGSSNCTLPYDGKLSVESTYGGSSFPASSFTFTFFRGANTLSSNAITATSSSGSDPYISDGHVLNRLSSGQYTVRATYDGCSKEEVFTVAAEAPVLPVVSVSEVLRTHNSVCVGGSSTPTGAIDASSAVTTGGSVSSGGYMFMITSSVLMPNSRSSTTGLFSSLPTGDYVLEVSDQDNGCRSSGNTIRIEQRSNLEDIRIDGQSSDTACVALSASGSVRYTTVLVSGATVSAFRHEIYRGANRDPASRVGREETQVPSHNFSGLEDGLYRIVVWDVASNCFEEEDFSIVDEAFYPRYATPAATIEPNNSCSLDNGEISVHLVGRDGVEIADPHSTGYRFTWYAGSTNASGSEISGEESSTLSNRASGAYATTIVGPNGCETLSVRSFNVPDGRVIAGVDIVTSSALRSCAESEANGVLQAQVTSGGVATDFSFEWWYAASFSPSISVGTSGSGFSTSAEIMDRWEGQYALRATHSSSGCSAEDTHILRSTRESPVVELSSTPTDNTACSEPWNGSAEVRIQYEGSTVSDFTDFSFTLEGMAIGATTGLSALGSNPTGHRLEVSRRACIGSLSIAVGDKRELPGLTGGTERDSRSCDENRSPDGEIEVSPDGTDGRGYTFTWYSQPFSSTAPVFSPTSDQLGTPPTGTGPHHLVRLRSGNYSVRVVHDATSCEGTRNYQINLNPNTAPVGIVSREAVTVCSPPNGLIRVDLSGGSDASEYDWEWFEGLVDPLSPGLATPLSGADVSVPAEASALARGYYSVRWTERSTACRSDIRTAYVDISSTVKPVFVASNPSPAGDCRGAEGEGRVDISGPVGRRFDVRIYTGSPSDFTGVTPAAEATGIDTGPYDMSLPANTYTVRVTETSSQCDSIESLTINYINSPTVVTISNIEPSNCAPYTDTNGDGGQGGASGSVQVRLAVDASSGIDHDRYQIFLYAAPDLSSMASFNPMPAMTTGSREWRISDGRPRVIQGVSAAESGAATGSVSTSTLPAETGSLGAGITVNSAGRHEREYIFAGLAGNTNSSIENYLIIAAEEDQASCFSTPVSFNVPRGNNDLIIPDIQIDLAAADALGRTITNNGSCGAPTSADGRVAVRGIERRGGSIGRSGEEIGAATLQVNYGFEWFEGSTVDDPSLGTNVGRAVAEVASRLPSGRYTLRVTKTSPGDDFRCRDVFVYTVNNNSSELSITGLDVSDISACMSPDDVGSIEIREVDIGSGDVAFPSQLDLEVVVRSSTNQQQRPNITPSSVSKTDLAEDVYTLVLQNTSTLCQSDGLLARIEDNRSIPGINKAGSTIDPNTNCGAANGAVNIALRTTAISTSDLIYLWHEGADTSTPIMAPGMLSGGSTSIGFRTKSIGGLPSQDFTVVVTHVPSNCTSEETFFVPDERVYPRFAFNPSGLSHSTTCESGVGSGRVTIESGDVLPSPSIYSIELFSDEALSTAVGTSKSLDQRSLSSVMYNDLLPMVYYIRAVDVSACSSEPAARFEIRDEQDTPQLESYTVTNDKGCGSGSLMTGAVDIRLLITDPSYRYDVTIGPNTESNVSTSVVPQISGLSEGTLPIRVLNTVTRCEYVSEVAVVKEEPEFRIESLNNVQQTQCDGMENGMIQVLDLRFNGETLMQNSGSGSVFTDFGFVWTDETGATRTPVREYELLRLQAGDYSVEITQMPSTCREEAMFTVKANLVYPLIEITEEAKDEGCTAASASGVLVATADGRDDVFDSDSDGVDYAFRWKDEDGNAVGTTARVERLRGERTYLLEVLSNETGCSSEQEASVEASPITPVVEIENHVTYAAVTVCTDPADGSVEISDVRPGVLSDYRLSWYDANPTLSPPPPPKETVEDGVASFMGLSLQKYYFKLEHKTWGCETDFYEVMPPDETTSPHLILEGVVLQTRCDPDRPNGEIEVSVDGVQDTDQYDFEWRLGSEVVSPVLDKTTRLTERRAGTYTVLATDKTTACSQEEDFTLRDLIIDPLELTFDVQSNSRCEEEYNGIIITDIREKLPGKQLSDYGFYWQEGTETPSESNSLHSTNAWENRNTSIYTVVAYDRDDPVCRSEPTQVEVGDDTPAPQVEITQVHPLTYCLPERANARLRAVVPNEPDYVMNYRFKWFEMPEVIISNSYEAEGLGDRTYFVVATHALSDCTAEASFTISPSYDYPPPPKLMLERSRTDCSVPNGVASAAVIRGVVEDYSYEWFPFLDPDFIVSTEARADNLDVGVYHVHLTSKETGCRSLAPAAVEVFNAIVDKRFRIITTPSLCTKPTGIAEIVPVDPFEIRVVEWTHVDDGLQFEGNIISGAPPGEYKVVVADETNCLVDTTFVLPDKIEPYNGLSVNSDNMNDLLVVDCIERYPDNILRLFDRDGNLVFEQESYDNQEHVFQGQGNRGLYIGGKRLPDGTYYYIIETGVEDVVVSGFMELIN